MSGMKRVLRDGYLILEKQMRFGNFRHSISLDNHMLSIVELDDRFDLRIDNQPFSLLQDSSKRKKENYKSDGYKDLNNYRGGREYDYKPPTHPAPRPKPKKEGFEFDTGFGKYEYNASSEAQRREYRTCASANIGIANDQWHDNTEPIPNYNEPNPKKEEYNWDQPANFQLEESKSHTQITPACCNKPKQPIRSSQITHTEPVKEEPKPLIDFLDMDQHNTEPDDLFANGLNFGPAPMMAGTTDQFNLNTQQTVPVQPTSILPQTQIEINQLFTSPQPAPNQTAYSQSMPSYQPPMNTAPSVQYTQPSINPSMPLNQPTINQTTSTQCINPIASPIQPPTIMNDERKLPAVDANGFFSSGI